MAVSVAATPTKRRRSEQRGRAKSHGFSIVGSDIVGNKLARYPANQVSKSLHIVRGRRLDRTGQEFVTPFVYAQNAVLGLMGNKFCEKSQENQDIELLHHGGDVLADKLSQLAFGRRDEANIVERDMTAASA